MTRSDFLRLVRSAATLAPPSGVACTIDIRTPVHKHEKPGRLGRTPQLHCKPNLRGWQIIVEGTCSHRAPGPKSVRKRACCAARWTRAVDALGSLPDPRFCRRKIPLRGATKPSAGSLPPSGCPLQGGRHKGQIIEEAVLRLSVVPMAADTLQARAAQPTQA